LLVGVADNVLGIGEEGAFENRQSNIRTKVDSSTTVQLLPSAPFLPIPCYSQWFLSDAPANHCQYYSFPPLSCRLVWLRIFYFQKGRKFFLFNFVSVGKVKALLQALV